MIDLRRGLRRLWSGATGWIVPLWDRLRPAPSGYGIRKVEDLPERLRPGVLYVVAEGRTETQASMACPLRRCGDTLNMNLMPDDDPIWRLSIGDDGRPSLTPSVWRKQDCGCHFWLRDGRIEWCR